MKRTSAGRPLLINVIVTVALVTIFSTGSVTAALIVKSVNIVDGEVKTPDLANGAVTTAKIATDAVTGAKVNETTLGIVPNANTLDGRDSTSFVSGPGRVVFGGSVSAWVVSEYIFVNGTALDLGFNVAARCSENNFFFTNWGTEPWDVWIRADGGDPVYHQVFGYPIDTFSVTGTAAPPHFATMHIVQPSTGRQGIVEMSVRGTPPPGGSGGYGECWTYATATLNY